MESLNHWYKLLERDELPNRELTFIFYCNLMADIQNKTKTKSHKDDLLRAA